jgi:hypothetical protein
MLRARRPDAVDLEHDSVEAIALQGFRPPMRRAVERGERFPRDHALVRSFPAYFGLLLPMSELEEVK